MICSTCGKQIRTSCADCRAKRQRIGILRHQRRFLETWQAGSLKLRFRRKNGAAHLELFDDRWHTFCGIDLFNVPPHATWAMNFPDEFCAECRNVLDQQLSLLKE